MPRFNTVTYSEMRYGFALLEYLAILTSRAIQNDEPRSYIESLKKIQDAFQYWFIFEDKSCCHSHKVT